MTLKCSHKGPSGFNPKGLVSTCRAFTELDDQHLLCIIKEWPFDHSGCSTLCTVHVCRIRILRSIVSFTATIRIWVCSSEGLELVQWTISRYMHMYLSHFGRKKGISKSHFLSHLLIKLINRDERGGRCLWGWQSPELQPSAMRNLDNPESGTHPGAVTLLTSGF